MSTQLRIPSRSHLTIERVKPKILILSASFGDGHNSAARHLAQALEEQAETLVADPCHIGNPRINAFLCKAYREITTYTPKIWAWMYRSTDRQDFSQPLPFLAKTEDAVANLLNRFEPDLVVNTYPLYPYMVDRQFSIGRRVPIITIVTDSIEINAAWTRSPSDYFLITDDHTREGLITSNLPKEKMNITGFPVSPRFESLEKVAPNDPLNPFRILFFPTARSPHVIDIMKAALSHENHITVILGRNVRRLYRKLQPLKKSFPGRIHIKGWTRKVPELLSSHHLVIGKAGGATVHEAIAAQCPMLVHQIVPGQEEGNIELLNRFQTGSLATSPKTIRESISNLLADDATLWREQKKRLAQHARPSAAREAANFILSKVKPS